MAFINQAVTVLQTLVIALGAGLAVWGVVNLMEGYGNDNPGAKLPEEKRPVGHWGRLHQAYLRMYRPGFYNELVLSCKLHTYLADLNEQATERCSLIIEQMAEAEGVDETLKASDQMLWVQSMNSIRSRAEEIIKHELIYG